MREIKDQRIKTDHLIPEFFRRHHFISYLILSVIIVLFLIFISAYDPYVILFGIGIIAILFFIGIIWIFVKFINRIGYHINKKSMKLREELDKEEERLRKKEQVGENGYR